MDNSGKLLGAQINREWFLYQEKEVFAEYRQKRLTIGLPNETERRENRVCLTPEAVAMMVDMGHTNEEPERLHITMTGSTPMREPRCWIPARKCTRRILY